MGNKEILIKVSEKQARIISEGMELLARLGMGQFDSIDHIPFLMERRFENESDYKELEEAINKLRSVYFPKLYSGQYYGMKNQETPEDSKIAWDIYQTIRYAISWHNNPEGGMTVNFDKPHKTSITEMLPQCEYVKK